MDDTLQIITCTTIPPDSCIVSCNCGVGTSSTAVVDVSAPYDVESYVIGGIVIVMILVVGCLLRKRIVQLEKKTVNLRNLLSECNQHSTLLKNEVEALVAKVDDLPSNFVRVTENCPQISADNDDEFDEKGDESSVLSVRYATLQAPDENGVLRFSERTMVESSSSEKMFVLELDFDDGIGTYGINPEAMSLILNDLQMFAEYVKPFSYNGNVEDAVIENGNLGRIARQGSYWIVVEPLEIKIHN